MKISFIIKLCIKNNFIVI